MQVMAKPRSGPSALGGFPLVTIQEAARRTGIGTITLRAWERRYGVPRPARTHTGYRLYAQADLREISSMIRLHRGGVALRQAAFLVSRQRMFEAEGEVGKQLTAWRRQFELACLRFDEAAVQAILDEALQAATPVGLLRDVIFPVVVALGEGREAGVISISQEHFASELARTMVARHCVPVNRTSSRDVVLTGCAPGEQHELGLLAIVGALRVAGLQVVHLGPNVPVDSFLAAVERVKPRLAIVAATIPAHLQAWIENAARARRWAERGVSFVWAGPGAAKVRHDRLPGTASASIDEVIDLATQPSPPVRRRGRMDKPSQQRPTQAHRRSLR